MNTNDRYQGQDSENALRELMQRGYAGAPEVDLERAAWREGRRRRTRRLVRGTLGGAGLVAAAAASAFALSGVLQPEAAQVPLPAERPTVDPTQDPAPSEDPATEEPGPTEEPDPTTEPPVVGTPIGAGHAVVAPEGWLVVPVWDSSPGGSGTIASCVVDPEHPGYVDGSECPPSGVRLETGIEEQPLEPFWATDICYADPERAEVSDVTVSAQVQTGEAVIGGQPATWRRWSVTCEDGRTFEPVQHWLGEVGVLATSVLGGDDLPSVLDGLAVDAGAAQLRGELLVTDELGTTSVAGELHGWTGDPRLIDGTGNQVEYAITEDTVCLVEDVAREAPPGMFLVPGSCAELAERVRTTRVDYSAPTLLWLLVDDTGSVVTISRQYTP